MSIGYVRTSKDEQNPANQIDLIMKQGVHPDHVFVDAGVSGSVPAEDRPGYSAMVKFIEKNKPDTIYIFEISRLGRSFLDTLARVIAFEEQGTKIISLSPQESWTKLEDRSLRNLILSIFSWIYEQERKNLIARTIAGQARAREQGKHIGRPKRDINWKKVDEYLAKDISLSAVSRLMDIPYTSMLRGYKERGEVTE